MDGFEVFTAQSGAEAIKVLTEIEAPALILLDMRMEDMMGSDLLLLLEDKIPEVIKDVPVVFHSAMDEVPPSKAAGFIRKTGNIEKFLEAIHSFIETGRPAYYSH